MSPAETLEAFRIEIRALRRVSVLSLLRNFSRRWFITSTNYACHTPVFTRSPLIRSVIDTAL